MLMILLIFKYVILVHGKGKGDHFKTFLYFVFFIMSEEKKYLYKEKFPYLKLNQVSVTHVHLPVLLHTFRRT